MDINGLPNELLLPIARTFALKPPETGHPVSREAEQNRAVLLTLSKTSRRLAWAANSILYESMIVTKPSRLAILLRTLSQNRQLASYVKHFACMVTFDKHENKEIQQAWHTAFSQIDRDLAPDVKRILRYADIADDHLPIIEVDESGERVFAALIALLPNLQSILLQPRAARMQLGTKQLYHALSVSIYSIMLDRQLGPTTLQKLTTVKVQPMITRSGDTVGHISCAACISLFVAPNLRIFEGCHAIGGWQTLPFTLKDVRLFGSLKPDTMSMICEISNLERLTVQAELGYHDLATIGDDVFNTALTKRASTLKYLSIHTRAYRSLNRSLGPETPLHCLKKFSHIEELDVEFYSLLGDSSNLDPKKGLKLQNILPSSLKKFSLYERWNYHDSASNRLGGVAFDLYHKNIELLLTSFAESCMIGGMVAMRKFTFVRPDRNDIYSPSMECLKQAFSKNGVEMVVVLETC